MDLPAQHARAWVAALACAAMAACGNRSTVERTYSQGDDPLGEPTSGSGSSIVFHGSEAEARLARAKAQARAGQFEDAIREFQGLYQDQGYPAEVHAEALLRWAEAEGNLLNPQRDLDAAVGHLELFLERFPDSPLAPDAQASLARLRGLRDAGQPGGG